VFSSKTKNKQATNMKTIRKNLGKGLKRETIIYN